MRSYAARGPFVRAPQDPGRGIMPVPRGGTSVRTGLILTAGSARGDVELAIRAEAAGFDTSELIYVEHDKAD